MSEWISVGDRLPEHLKPVLIRQKWMDETMLAMLNSNKGKLFWTEVCENHVCNGDAWCDFEVDERCNMPVTHWMPLPTPPEAS